MGNINERLIQLRKHFGLSQAAFGERIKISRDTIANLETFRTKPTPIMISAICHEFSVSEAWLVEGVGEMFRSESPAEAVLRVMAGEDEVAKAIFLALAESPPEHWEAFRQYALRLKAHLEALPPDLLPPNQKGGP